MFTVVSWQLMVMDVTEGCRSEWSECKGNPTGLSLVGSPNWMPGQGESRTEPPWRCPEWVQWTKCNPSNKYFVKGVWHLLLERFTVGKFNFDVLCWLRKCEFTVSLSVKIVAIMLYYLHFCLLLCLSNWGFMITWKFGSLSNYFENTLVIVVEFCELFYCWFLLVSWVIWTDLLIVIVQLVRRVTCIGLCIMS